MGNFLWSLIELVVLIFIGWPVAGFCAMLYILIAPFDACISGKSTKTKQVQTTNIRLPQANGYTKNGR